MQEKMTDHPRLPTVAVFTIPAILVTVIVFLAAAGADAARYTVSECGWYVGHDATWTETSGSKFVRSSYCQPSRSSSAFEGVHLTSETRSGSNSVSGTKFARWRWDAPSGVTITNVHGHRWQVVRDGFEHRLGAVTAAGFTPFMKLATTDTARRDFKQTLSAGTTAFESRLLCARSAEKWCSAVKSSLAGVRALTLTLEDPHAPTATVGGELATDGWLRGSRSLTWSEADRGAGLRLAETSIDGTVRARTAHSCNTVTVGGLVRGSRMQPCVTAASGQHTLDTATLNDGPHQLRHCAIDFAGTGGCTTVRTVRTDNTAPAAPRELAVAGGDAWRNVNRFDLGWVVPGQGEAAPVTVSRGRISGPDGYDGGVFNGSAPNAATGLTVPGPGEYRVRIWLADAAGNEREDASAGATLRFDDIPPTGFFDQPSENPPERLEVPVADRHSGVAGGTIAIRPAAAAEWRELPAALAGTTDDRRLVAEVPGGKLTPGGWVARAVVRDVAGNETVITTRGNGAPMEFQVPARKTAVDRQAVSSLTARLIGPGHSGLSVRVGYRRHARLAGRLVVDGRGLAGRQIRVDERPAQGARQRPLTRFVKTGPAGYFRLTLRRGASRQVTASFAGADRITASSVGPLKLRVRGALSFKVKPRKLRTGMRTRFRGRVMSRFARRPRRGGLVQVQYLERASGRWRPVLITRTGLGGRYRASYRFRYITGNAKIRLRAVLLRSPWFPHDQAVSRAVTVRVRG